MNKNIHDLAPKHNAMSSVLMDPSTSHNEKVSKFFDMVLEGTFNRSKFKAMSKRRQKNFMWNFAEYYDTKTGKHVHRDMFDGVRYLRIPLKLTFVEKTGKPFNDMMDTWIKNLVEGS